MGAGAATPENKYSSVYAKHSPGIWSPLVTCDRALARGHAVELRRLRCPQEAPAARKATGQRGGAGAWDGWVGG
jgi:hypothetical protein